MTLSAAAASLPTITAFIAALIGLAAAIAGLVAIPEYRRKLKAQRAELDTQLAQLFAQLVPIADGYGQPALPDSALAAVVEALVEKDDLDRLRGLLRSAYVTAPVGAATQIAAIWSIAYLGQTYESLATPAQACLEALAFSGHQVLEAAREEALQSFRDRPAGS